MIRGELSLQTKTLNKEKKRFFQPILAAWGILTYDRAKFFKDLIPSSLSREYPGETTIKLDPFQTRIIDALTEAFDIPHERGQAEIEIPEKLRSTKKG
jgi:hypothetical protein